MGGRSPEATDNITTALTANAARRIATRSIAAAATQALRSAATFRDVPTTAAREDHVAPSRHQEAEPTDRGGATEAEDLRRQVAEATTRADALKARLRAAEQEALHAISRAQEVADLYCAHLEAAIAAVTPAPPPEAPAAEAFRYMQGEVRAAARESTRQDPAVEQAAVDLRASIRQTQDVAYAMPYGEGAGTSAQRALDPGQRPGKAPKNKLRSALNTPRRNSAQALNTKKTK